MNNNFKIILLVIVVVIIIIIACGCLKHFLDNKNKLSKTDNSRDSHSKKLNIVNSWMQKTKNKVGSENRYKLFENLTNHMNNQNLIEKEFGVYLSVHPDLERIRSSIFKFQPTEIQLSSYLSNDPDYKMISNVVLGKEEGPLDIQKKAELEDKIRFLVKYRKFMKRADVYSLAGPREVNQVYTLMLNIISNNVEGDLIETGAWKGGMGMWMKAIYNHFLKKRIDATNHSGIVDKQNRQVWLFDTFDSFPNPSPVKENINEKDKESMDLARVMYGDTLHIDDVRDGFKKFGLLDDSVKLVKGNLNITIPAAVGHKNIPDSPIISKIALLRIDCDHYNAVYASLSYLYNKIQKGGYVIVDDYNNPIVGCRQAVDDFRSENNITEEIMDKHGGPIYWQIS